RHETIVSRSAEGLVVTPRRFGRRAGPAAAGAHAHTPSAVQDASSPYLEAAADTSPVNWVRVAQKGGLLLLVLAGGVFLHFSTLGLPGCDSYKAQDLLRQLSREALARANIRSGRVGFAHIAEVPTSAWGVNKCAATVLVDGRQGPRVFYEISWSVRLVVFNRYVVKVVSATP